MFFSINKVDAFLFTRIGSILGRAKVTIPLNITRILTKKMHNNIYYVQNNVKKWKGSFQSIPQTQTEVETKRLFGTDGGGLVCVVAIGSAGFHKQG